MLGVVVTSVMFACVQILLSMVRRVRQACYGTLCTTSKFSYSRCNDEHKHPRTNLRDSKHTRILVTSTVLLEVHNRSA